MTDGQQGILAIISGPSGVGKSTVISEVLRQRPDLFFSISYTTRAPRDGEVNGVHYFFVDKAEFERMIRDDELIEYAQYNGNYYGTSAKLIDDKLSAGIDVLLDIEVIGSKIVQDKRPGTPSIFIIPPYFDALSERLHARNTDNEATIQNRITRAREELKETYRYDYLVVNDDKDKCAQEVVSILCAEHCKTAKRIHLV